MSEGGCVSPSVYGDGGGGGGRGSVCVCSGGEGRSEWGGGMRRSCEGLCGSHALPDLRRAIRLMMTALATFRSALIRR